MKYGIPLTLGTPYNQPRTRSRPWAVQNIWGDYTGPYDYLSKIGVSKEKLAYNLTHGLMDSNPTTSEDKPAVNPTRAGTANPTSTDGTNYIHIDQFGGTKNVNLYMTEQHIANYKYGHTFIMDYNIGRELVRARAGGIYRPDINQACNILGNVGHHTSFNTHNFPNKKVYAMTCTANDPEGDTRGGAQDLHDKR